MSRQPEWVYNCSVALWGFICLFPTVALMRLWAIWFTLKHFRFPRKSFLGRSQRKQTALGHRKAIFVTIRLLQLHSLSFRQFGFVAADAVALWPLPVIQHEIIELEQDSGQLFHGFSRAEWSWITHPPTCYACHFNVRTAEFQDEMAFWSLAYSLCFPCPQRSLFQVYSPCFGFPGEGPEQFKISSFGQTFR